MINEEGPPSRKASADTRTAGEANKKDHLSGVPQLAGLAVIMNLPDGS